MAEEHFHSIKELKSFRLMKFHRSSTDKGLAFVKVKSLDLSLCKLLQKIRSRYIIATSECYYNSPEDVNNIASMSKYFDFHIVSCDSIGTAIAKKAPGTKYAVVGAGEFLTSPDVFRLENTKTRNIDFVASANSFWALKNFHKVLEMQKYLKDNGKLTKSKIICGSIKDQWYYKECQDYIKQHLLGQADIVIGSDMDGLRKTYNDARFLVHLSSVDSSPRVVFEALLCGCHCVLSGSWTESLNSWLSSPLVHVIPDDYSSVVPLLSLPPDYNLSQKYNSLIGMRNIFPRISSFVQKNIQSTFSDKDVIDQSCVGKVTFKQMEDRYSAEMKLIQRMLK